MSDRPGTAGPLQLYTIPPHGAFLDALATDWLDRAGGDPLAAADGLILLPTRRAARALADAFLHAAGGRPLLLPRVAAIGALDEAPLALAGALALPPAVPAPVRLAHLTRLVMALDRRFGAPDSADQAWPLAAELAALMDEAERAEVDLATVLPKLAEGDHATHWGITLDFLRIVTASWPAWLAENGLMNPAARQVALLHAQAAAWERAPPPMPVLAAGSTGGIAAVARLLRVVARLPNGRVVLPGLDLDMPEPAWDALDDSHPQSALRRLLAGLGATRGDVRRFPAPDGAPAGRSAALHRALLPAGALATWRCSAAVVPAGMARLSPADQQEEAVAIALVLRGALEQPHRRAALVTPDRDLAGRVAVELGRFGVVADDSAGERLADTPPAVFLRLLADAVAEALRPVPLLALLKHPLAAAGLDPAACRAAARALETEALRGPAPASGLAGLRGRIRSGRAARLHRPGGRLPGPRARRGRRRGGRAVGRAARPAPGGGGAGGHPRGGRRAAALGRRGRPGAGRAAGRAAARAGRAAAAAGRHAAGPAGGRAGRRRGPQPPRAARPRRGGAPADLHLGPAGGAAATRRPGGAGRAGGGRVARRRRPGAVDEPADARRRRPAFPGGGGRPGGA